MIILDIQQFFDNGIVTTAVFYEKVAAFDWEALRDKTVLVKGCGSAIVPPWAFMVVTARLARIAACIHYGNEHSSFPIFMRASGEAVDVKR